MASSFAISDITKFLGTKLTILVSVVLILIITMIVLTILQRRMRKKLISKKALEYKSNTLIQKIEKLKNSKKSPKATLITLDRLARNYFMEVYRFRKSIEYSDMIHFFTGKDKGKIIDFCKQMLKSLYSGQEIRREDLDQLVADFYLIVQKEKPSIRIKKEDRKYVIPQKNQEEYYISMELKTADKKHIGRAYNELQKLFSKTYEKAVEERNKPDLKKLKKYRRNIIKKVNDYLKNNSKMEELAHEIKRSSQLLSFLLNNEKDKEKEQLLLGED